MEDRFACIRKILLLKTKNTIMAPLIYSEAGVIKKEIYIKSIV